jgi:hypothetical protein
VGLPEDDLRSGDLTKCQEIGEAVHYLGAESLLEPSAVAAGGVLAFFLDRQGVGSDVRVVEERLWGFPP